MPNSDAWLGDCYTKRADQVRLGRSISAKLLGVMYNSTPLKGTDSPKGIAMALKLGRQQNRGEPRFVNCIAFGQWQPLFQPITPKKNYGTILTIS